MEEMNKKILIHDINRLQECVMYLTEAKEALNDVDDTDNFYSQIHYLAEEINDFKLKKEAEI